jgi:hypothetical protein
MTCNSPSKENYGGFGFQDIDRPLTDNGRAKLRTFANNITNLFPSSSMASEINNPDPMDWAKEGKALAISNVSVGNSAKQCADSSVSNKREKSFGEADCARRISSGGNSATSFLMGLLMALRLA